MGFLDDLKVLGSDLLAKSSVVAKEAAQKAQDAADMAKIKVDIAAREKEIKDLYTKIGKAYYEANKEGAVDFAEDVAEINAKFAVIAELNDKYNMYKEDMSAAKEATAEEAEAEDDAIEIVPADVEETVEEKLDAVAEKVEEILDAVEEKVEAVVDAVEAKIEEVTKAEKTED